MSLILKRNILIFIGILLATIIKITIIIPHVNILLSVFCFYKKNQLNKLIN